MLRLALAWTMVSRAWGLASFRLSSEPLMDVDLLGDLNWLALHCAARSNQGSGWSSFHEIQKGSMINFRWARPCLAKGMAAVDCQRRRAFQALGR